MTTLLTEVENLNEIDLSTVLYCYKTCDEIGQIFITVIEDEEARSINRVRQKASRYHRQSKSSVWPQN